MGEAGLTMRWKWPVYLLAGYPIVDYFLHIDPWGVIGQNWATLLLLYLVFLAFRQYLGSGRTRFYPTHRMIVYMAVLGLVYIALDMEYVKVAVAGYQTDFMYMLIALLLPSVLSREDVVPVLKVVAVTGFLMAVHGVYEYIMAVPIPAAWGGVGGHVRTRVYSLFGSPNIFGSYMAFLVPLTSAVALYESDRGQRLFYGTAAVFCAASLVFTFTRGAWLACLVGFLVFTWLVDRRLTLGVIGVALLAYFLVPPIHARIQEFASPVYWVQTFGGGGRIARWGHAYDQMRRNPLFGAGLGRYGGAVAARFFGSPYVDNYYAKTLAETGLLGLVSYLALIGVYLRDVFRIWRNVADLRMKRLIAGVFSALVVFTAHAFVENIFEVPTVNMLFWLVGTLVLIYGAGEGGRHDRIVRA